MLKYQGGSKASPRTITRNTTQSPAAPMITRPGTSIGQKKTSEAKNYNQHRKTTSFQPMKKEKVNK